MRVLIGFLRLILSGTMCLTLFCNICLLVSQHVYGETPPSVFGYTLVSIQDIDMQPKFRAGDVMVVTERSIYEIGEVIALKHDKDVIIRRIVGQNSGGLITQGDARPNTDDTPLHPTDIVGEAVLHIPYMSAAADFLQTPICTAVLSLFLILFIIVPMIVESHLKRQLRRTHNP